MLTAFLSGLLLALAAAAGAGPVSPQQAADAVARYPADELTIVVLRSGR